MISETKKASEYAAYQLGWMAYENGATDCEPFEDEEFAKIFEECATEGTMLMAYARGFTDAMVTAIGVRD